MQRDLPDEAATRSLAAAAAAALPRSPRPLCLSLAGSLGAGKTSFARAFLQALGHPGPVVSPTYTLVEPYEFARFRVLHLDLYRISDPEELAFLGLRDIDRERDWLLVEWFANGEGWLPPPDVTLQLAYAGQGRHLQAAAAGEAGGVWLDAWQAQMACG